MKKLNLKKETLADLTAEDLAVVAGAAVAAASRDGGSGITYRCVLPTGGCVIQVSNTCFQYFTNNCTVC